MWGADPAPTTYFEKGKRLNRDQAHPDNLPIKGTLTLNYALSLIIALLMAAASITGIVYRANVYPTDDLLQAFVPTDVVNLLIGVPILLGSVWLARRGQLIGLLLWPGALFFVLYTYAVYVLAMPFNVASVAHLILLIMSLYTTVGLLAGIDGGAVQQRLAGHVPERLAGGILATLGVLFCLRAAGVMAGALVSQSPMAETELAPNIADTLTAPALAIGGVLLWRRERFGYIAGLGLLFQASMLFIGLIVLLTIQPFVTGAPFVVVDVVVTFVLGLICFIPFALFARGVVSASRASDV